MQILERGGMQWPHQVSLWPPKVDENESGIGEFFIPLLPSQLFEEDDQRAEKSSYCVSYAYKIFCVSSGHTPANPDCLSEAPAMHKVRVAVPLIIYPPWFLIVSVTPSFQHLMPGNHTHCVSVGYTVH